MGALGAVELLGFGLLRVSSVCYLGLDGLWLKNDKILYLQASIEAGLTFSLHCSTVA